MNAAPYLVQAGKPGSRSASVERACLDDAEAARVKEHYSALFLPLGLVVRVKRIEERRPA